MDILRFSIAVYGGPYHSQAALSALRFSQAVINSGHKIYRVFFYHDGVNTGNKMIVAPQDELNLNQAWSSFSKQNDVELIVCVASALRRGMLDERESARYEKPASTLDPQFTISGLGQLIDGALSADRFVTFGA